MSWGTQICGCKIDNEIQLFSTLGRPKKNTQNDAPSPPPPEGGRPKKTRIPEESLDIKKGLVWGPPCVFRGWLSNRTFHRLSCFLPKLVNSHPP